MDLRMNSSAKTRETRLCCGTVLLAELCGVPALAEQYGYDRAFVIVRDCLLLLYEAAERYGGSIDDQFGEWVMVTFGINEPVENAPWAAASSAIDMRRRIGSYAREHRLASVFNLQVGVDSGSVVSGNVTEAGHLTTAVMGEAVARATALKNLAPPGCVFLGREAYLATRNDFEFREVNGSLGIVGGRGFRAYELLDEGHSADRVIDARNVPAAIC